MPQLKPFRGLQLNRSHPLSRGLVFFPPFNEGSGNKVFDLSGNGNTGTQIGTAPSWSAGKFGPAVLLPGTDEYIDCGQVISGYPFTLSAWVYLSTLPAPDDASTIMSISSGIDIYYHAIIVINWGGVITVRVRSYDGTTLDIDEALDVTNNWHLITGVWANDSSRKLYIDGIFKGEETTQEDGDIGYASAKIGVTADSTPTYYADGLFDHAMIYNRALSDTEIALLYREPFCMFERMVSPGLLYAPAVGALTASVFDSITVTESVTPQLPLLLADVSDSVTVDESITPLMPLLLSTLFDSVGVTESITPLMPLLEVSVYDSVTVAESAAPSIGNWVGINSSHYDSHCGDDGVHTIEKALDGTSYWGENVNETHWFIVDLGTEYNVLKMRARSTGANDPTVVNVYVSNDKEDWGDAVASGIDTWQDTTEWAEVDTIDKLGQFVKVEITETEDSINYINFGMPVSHVAIFDIYGVPVPLSVSVFDSVNVDEDVSTHLPLLEANVSDSITVTESIEAILPLYEVLEYDTITVAESVSLEEYLPVISASVYDSITVSELVTAYMFSMWTRVTGDNDITWQNPSGSNSVTWRNPTDSNSITWRNV